jgi:hypothetical protein
LSNDTTVLDGLPSSWSESARETYAQIAAAQDPLDVATAASLYEACALLASADAMQERVDSDGLMVAGSRGQLVAHPLIVLSTSARVQALAALRNLGLTRRAGSEASNAGRALVSKRYGRK